MICPICGANARDTDLECSGCGESLTSWNTLRRNGEALRQRGLAWAAKGDHVGALLSFLEATLANPLDEKSLLDAARALVHLGKPEHAERLLAQAATRPGAKAAAEALRDAIRRRPAAAPPRPEPPAPKPVPAVVDAPLACPRRPLLGLGALALLKASWRGRLTPISVDQLWAAVLDTEQKDAGADWTGQPRPLAQVMGKVEGLSVIHYAFGLGHWQTNHNEGALRAFQACIEREPPVLSPYAYYLCLLAGDPGRLADAVERLRGRKKFGKENLDACLNALEARLRNFGDLELHRAIRGLCGTRVA